MRIELTTRTLQVSVASLETCLPIKLFRASRIATGLPVLEIGVRTRNRTEDASFAEKSLTTWRYGHKLVSQVGFEPTVLYCQIKSLESSATRRTNS